MIQFVLGSILLGTGLAMDAFSVSLANGLAEPKMSRGRMLQISGVFGGFQFLMPLIGWLCVHTILSYFRLFELAIPWIAFGLLAYIGGKMVWESFHEESEEVKDKKLTFQELMVQGIATSIDALSVGFTIAEYSFLSAFASCVIIGVTTWLISLAGLLIGRRFGMKFASKATLFGGLLLIAIGLEILLSHLM